MHLKAVQLEGSPDTLTLRYSAPEFERCEERVYLFFEVYFLGCVFLDVLMMALTQASYIESGVDVSVIAQRLRSEDGNGDVDMAYIHGLSLEYHFVNRDPPECL